MMQGMSAVRYGPKSGEAISQGAGCFLTIGINLSGILVICPLLEGGPQGVVAPATICDLPLIPSLVRRGSSRSAFRPIARPLRKVLA